MQTPRSCFAAIFASSYLTKATHQSIITLLLFHCKLAPAGPTIFISKMVFVLNFGRDCNDVMCQSDPNEHIDVASHPVWDEGQWKLSGWACLERFMGTTSARAAGGSPLTMLWLLLWTINRCSFLFSSPPPPSFSLPHPLPLRLVSPCKMATALPFEFGKHTMRHERRQSWYPGCQSLTGSQESGCGEENVYRN